MTRKEFDDVMYESLLIMGDDTYKSNDSAWDKEYEQMKFLDIPSFKKLCKVRVNYWDKSQKAGTN